MNRLSKTCHGDRGAFESYLSDLAKHPSLTDEEAATLALRSSSGCIAAQEALVHGHLRMVVRIVRAYGSFGLPMADLVAEGNIGLIRAAELYDPRFGTKFSSYAIIWIKQRIHRAITAQAHAVRIPMWRSQRLRKVAALHGDLLARLGRPPSEDELAERLGLSREDFQEIEGDRIRVVSLDAPLSPSDPGAELGHTFADEAAAEPGSRLSRAEFLEEMIACLHDLDDRELEVVAGKYGIRGGRAGTAAAEPVSFRELGRRWGFSGEWVRRIGELALVKVRRLLESGEGFPPEERRRRSLGVLARIVRLTSQDPDATSPMAG